MATNRRSSPRRPTMSLEPASSTSIRVQTCAACGAELAPTLLSCPSCRRLVHTDRLKALAEAAESAERDDNPSLALASWQEAITLLPRGTRQYALIAERIARLGRQVESSPVRSPAARPASDAPTTAPGEGQSASGWSKGAASGVAGTLALAAWKFKFHPENGFVCQQETEAIGRYSLWGNGLIAKVIGFVWALFR